MKKLSQIFQKKKQINNEGEKVDIQDLYIHRPMKRLPSTFASSVTPISVRKDYAIKGARVFALENFLTYEECKFYIEQTQILTYESIDWEYTRDYRDCKRVVIKSKEFADLLWSRLLPFLNRDDLADVRPFGFGNEGVWRPTGINECIRFSKYTKGGHFQPHRDGSFVWNEEERSIYTLQVYLNDECQGGNTLFYEKFGGDAVSVAPKTGTALVFNHDVIHAGDTLKDGIKYILRTDIMFERVSAPMDEKSYKRNPDFLKMQQLYDMSIKAQKAKDPALSTKYYLEALEIQAKLRSIPSEINTRNEPWWLPNVIWLQILSSLSPKSLVSIGSTCHALKRMSRDPELWYNLFVKRWPLVKDENIDKLRDTLIKDWYHTYKYRHFADTTFQVVYIDFGASYTKFGVQGYQDGLNLEHKKVKSVIGHISGHYWSADSGYTNHIVGEDIATTFWHIYKEQYVYTESGSLDLYTMKELTGWMFQAAFGYRPEDKNDSSYYAPAYKARLSPASHPILIARPRKMTDQDEKALAKFYFNSLKVPYLLIKPSSELALFAVHQQSGIVVDGGEKYTTVSPVYRGKEITDKVKFFPVAGSKESESYFSKENDLVSLVKTVLESCSTEERNEIEKTILLIGGTSYVWQDMFKKQYKKNVKNIIWDSKDAAQMITIGANAFSRLVNAKDYFWTKDKYFHTRVKSNDQYTSLPDDM